MSRSCNCLKASLNRNHCHGLWVLGVAAIVSLPVPRTATAEGGSCGIPFDGSLVTRGGEDPVAAEEVTFTEGKTGQAAVFTGKARLSYPTAGCYDPRRGTVELWVRPNWDSSQITGDRLFWVVDNDPGRDNRISVGFFGDGKTGIVYFSNDGGFEAITAPVTWKAGQWHQLLACWDQDLRCRALYVDGRRIGVVGYSRDLPSQQKVFHVGYLPGDLRGVADGYQADAAIDELTLSAAVKPADFAAAAKALGADAKAKAARAAVLERLSKEYSLQRVAKEHIEVTWEDLMGLPPPFSKRVPVQARCHPDVIFTHPDLSIALGRDKDSLGIGFALGKPACLPDMYQVTRQLHGGYRPIVESRWTSGPITVTRTAFAVLPADEEVVTGKEAQYAVVRMTVTNTTDAPQSTALLLLVGQMADSQSINYGAFAAPVSRWQTPPLDVKLEGNVLTIKDRILLSYRCHSPAPAEFHASLDNASPPPGQPDKLTNCLRFDVALGAKGVRTIDFVVAGTSKLAPTDQRAAMEGLSFDAALGRAIAHWDRALEPGMKLITPEPRLNDIYRLLVLSSLENMSRNPDRPWIEPYQSPFLAMVWPWEFAHMAIPMISIGYHREMAPALSYFTERQVGVGKHAEKRAPEGDVMSTRGVYVGSSLYWMCETGAVLWTMASQYRYSRDAAWLKEHAAGILTAWDWIQRERARTRLRYDNGEKVEYYGLLPKGRVHDWEGWRYHFAFTDNYTWMGMSEMAAAFRQAGLPEADRMTREADDYRQCIVEAVARAQYVDPETKLLFIPNVVYAREGVHGGIWWADGPSALFATGLLAPTDERFEPTIEYTRKTWGILMGLSGHMEPNADHPYWYVNASERGYYMNYLARGEIEKALLVFYSNLVYGLSHDTYQTCERIDLRNPNYAPFQPNASGNGRMIEMFRRMVIDEQEPGVLWLLRGCPRRWFADGKSIAAKDAPTLFGMMGLQTQSNGGAVTVDIDSPNWQPPKEIRVVVRHPDRRTPSSVTVNGSPAKVEGETVILPAPTGHLRVVCTYAAGG